MNDIKALHCGCSYTFIPGFINADIEISGWLPPDVINQVIILDVEKKFQFEDNTFDYIYSEHMIEHLSYDGIKNYISECYRCLKPGGVIRTAWPKVDFLIELQNNPKKYFTYIKNHVDLFHPELLDDFKSYENIPVSLIINDNYRMWGHQIMYDIKGLTQMFKLFGFKNIISVNYGESKHDIFKGIEHSNKRGLECNMLETGVIECEK